MTHHVFRRAMSCEDVEACSDAIVAKLTVLGKFKADFKGDTVNGSVSISHENDNHWLMIETYDSDEAPNKKHSGNFKAVHRSVNKARIENELDR